MQTLVVETKFPEGCSTSEGLKVGGESSKNEKRYLQQAESSAIRFPKDSRSCL
jgi:hypothetical protein